jgi:hypothetical protein
MAWAGMSGRKQQKMTAKFLQFNTRRSASTRSDIGFPNPLVRYP